jgi:hypothetical protein
VVSDTSPPQPSPPQQNLAESLAGRASELALIRSFVDEAAVGVPRTGSTPEEAQREHDHPR